MHIHLRSLACLSEVIEAISRAAYIDQMFRLDDVLVHGDLLMKTCRYMVTWIMSHVPLVLESWSSSEKMSPAMK